ncbi:MAG: DUF58 domain-containing protein [Clostridia bacterium]|nr:DUF58 domain-containing protein [Clostridia bacterium]
MKKSRIVYGAWLLLSIGLYFFENNTGTRVVLLCAVLFPFIPPLRSVLLPRKETGGPEPRKAATVRGFLRTETEEPGDIRPWVPGDPVQRIHWKLSAKKDELLIRMGTPETEPIAETEEIPFSAGRREKRPVNLPAVLSAAGILLCALLLALVPAARQGFQELCNRLFAASEAVNAYSYRYFSVPENPDLFPAVCLLCCMGMLLAVWAAISRGPLPALGILAACTLGQVYFGLAFPAWILIPLYGLLAARMLIRPADRKALTAFCTLLLLLTTLTALLFPGTDAATEAASEKARDRLSRITEEITGILREAPEGETETRHIHPRSLENGEENAETALEFRLVTVEEEKIAMPHSVRWLKIILLLLLTAAAAILPFAPFMWLNARKRKAREARKAFESDNAGTAVQAIFRQVILWLEAMKQGAGNLLYRDWTERLPAGLPENYPERFARCAADCEEAVYSNHGITEEQRREALALLKDTESAMWKAANRRQRFYLKYWMGLAE